MKNCSHYGGVGGVEKKEGKEGQLSETIQQLPQNSTMTIAAHAHIHTHTLPQQRQMLSKARSCELYVYDPLMDP